MTLDLSHVTIWDDNTPTYNLGDGELRISQNYARITVPKDRFKDAGVTHKPNGFNMMASSEAGVLYEGTITGTVATISTHSNIGTLMVLKCRPAERQND